MDTDNKNLSLDGTDNIHTTCDGQQFKLFREVAHISLKIYRTIILLLVCMDEKTLSLTLREERRPSVFENRVLTRIFGLKRHKVSGEWRRLHNLLHAAESLRI
jgi:hypothetical protein